MIRILIADQLNPQAMEELSEIAEFEIVEKIGISKAHLKEEIALCDAIVVRSGTRMTREILSKAERLKLIVRAGIGLDNIDTDYAAQRGIEVRNTPGATSVSVAEYTIGMMLSAARSLGPAYQSLKEGRWERTTLSHGIELRGKTAGIIGLGSIGKEVARLLLALGMRVVFFDIDEIRTHLEVKPVQLPELLRISDFVLLHVPLTPLTRNMMGEAQLKLMKREAILINVACGGVVDEAALLQALKRESIQAAVLDVFAKEPPDNRELLGHPRLHPFPHLGAATVEGQERASFDVVKALGEFFNVSTIQ